MKIIFNSFQIVNHPKLHLLSLLIVCTIFTNCTPHKENNTIGEVDQISLNSGSSFINWQVKPQAEVTDSLQLFNKNYSTTDWVAATVPGVVFNDYVNAGIEKDPNFGDNIHQVDKEKYDRNFWYITTLKIPKNYKEEGKKIWLNFEGINRKADIFLNKQKLGQLDGFMDRGMFDITNIAKKDSTNILAVLVHWPQKPIPNYASPTYISSAGWDWMPYVPGLLMGITDDVYLSYSGDVTIQDPWIRTKVPSKKKAELSIQTELKNHSSKKKKGTLKGIIKPGNIEFEVEVELAANETKTIQLDKSKVEKFQIENPKLWWPNGYGEANLYTCDFKYIEDGEISDQQKETFGIREYSYDSIGGVLHLSINGEKVFLKGGNWGMSEYMLRCRGEEYFTKVRLHKEMNFNMIRNWIGSTTDEEFYEACDKYGIMIWDDFWLNSHKNLPRDVETFKENAIQKVKRLRNHPSIAIWCGDNESSPEPPLNEALQDIVEKYDKTDRMYQPNSRKIGGLSGSGPWSNFSPQTYFVGLDGFGGDENTVKGLRSEVGTAVFTTFESFKKFMPKEDWWPRNEMWNKHFFGKLASNGGPDQYEKSIDERYGKAEGIKDFTQKAQLLNLETNKAMFEGWRHSKWDDSSGILIWMSQSAYPSFVWQTYDYYYDLNGAFWGAKRGCEPLHIQWSAADNTVNVINGTLQDYPKLTAEAAVYDMKGNKLENYTEKKEVKIPKNKSTQAFKLNFNINNLAQGAQVSASSTAKDAKEAQSITDGSAGTRWSSKYNDDEWVTLNLRKPTEINTIRLIWESAYAKAYKVLVSKDGKNWNEIYNTNNSDGGNDEITFQPTSVQYIKMQGKKRATQWGYSLYEIEAYNFQEQDDENKLPPVHFIKLKLKNKEGEILSENFYWRGAKSLDYTALDQLQPVDLEVTENSSEKDNNYTVKATITNPKNSAIVALAVRVKLVNEEGEQYLPTFKSDSYFSLLPGESREVTLELKKDILKGKKPKLVVEPYNNIK